MTLVHCGFISPMKDRLYAGLLSSRVIVNSVACNSNQTYNAFSALFLNGAAPRHDAIASLQALQKVQGWIAVRWQAHAALVLADAALRGRTHHAVGRTAVEATRVQRRLQRQ